MINHNLKIKDSIHELKSQASGSKLPSSDIQPKEPTPAERVLNRIYAKSKQIKPQITNRTANWKMRWILNTAKEIESDLVNANISVVD